MSVTNNNTISPEAFQEAPPRRVVQRVVIEADLELETPAHFGNGDASIETDMPLLVDARDERSPLLTGATLAGALRSYLRASLPPKHGEWEQFLFGVVRTASKGDQSRVIVEDSLGKADTFRIEIRDGVTIDAKTRTAVNDFLYSRELWSAGTQFPIRVVLLIHDGDDELGLLRVLATALVGLSNGGITLGARKTRGLGRVIVRRWRSRTYKLTQAQDLMDWLRSGNLPLDSTTDRKVKSGDLASVVATPHTSQRNQFTINAIFSLESSLLIRSGGRRVEEPDMVYLGKERADQKPVLSGTSVAGSLRARAGRIARTLLPRVENQDNTDEPSLLREIFGSMDDKNERRASRLIVEERLIENAETGLIQNRVSIDRFTGGALDGALFNQQAVLGKEHTLVNLILHLRRPANHEVGLLLLLLKDLWTSDLPLGGEASVGRGRLRGISADLIFPSAEADEPLSWHFSSQPDNPLIVTGDTAMLEDSVAVLVTHLGSNPHEST